MNRWTYGTRAQTTILLSLALAVSTLTWMTGAPASAAEDNRPSLCDFQGYNPSALPIESALGPDGNVWFTDMGLKVGRVAPDGTMKVFQLFNAFNDPKLSLPSNIAAGPDGNMWVTLREPFAGFARITPAGQVTRFFDGIDPGFKLNDLTAGPDGNIWAVGAATNKVLRFKPDSGDVTTFEVGASSVRLLSIKAGPDGKIWFSGRDGGAFIGRMSITGDQIDLFTSGLGGSATSTPGSLVVGSDGNIWFTEGGSNFVGRVTPEGQITDYPVPPAPDAELLPLITHITPAPDGSLWFTDYTTGRIGRVTTGGGVSIKYTRTYHFETPDLEVDVPFLVRSPVFGTDGKLWIISSTVGSGTFAMVRLNPEDGAARAFVAGTQDILQAAVVDPKGTFWYLGRGAGFLGYIKPSGLSEASAIGATSFSHPTGLALAPDGNLWFTEPDHDRIARRNANGTISYFTQGITAASQPAGLTLGPDGNLWFSEAARKRIGRIKLDGTVTEFDAALTERAGQIVSSGGYLWFTEINGDGARLRIGRLTTKGVLTEFTPDLDMGSELGIVGGLTPGPDGNLWFTDVTGHDGAPFSGGRIGRMATDGTVTWFADGLPDGAAPFDITSAGGDLWIALYGYDGIARMSTDGTVTLFKGEPPNVPYPDYIAGDDPDLIAQFRAYYGAADHIFGGTDGSVWFSGAQGSLRRGTVPDRVGDPCSHDEDHDGLLDDDEVTKHHTNPLKADTDGDGLTDGRELAGWAKCSKGTSPLKADTDGDTLSDKAELTGYTLGTKVSTVMGRPVGKTMGLVRPNPCAKDTDGDKVNDNVEVKGSTINQKVYRDKKLGGVYTITTRRSNPLLKDTDKDGLTDRQEITGDRNTAHAKHRSDPTVADTDWGGSKDGLEIQHHSDPTVAGG